ncbi:ABC transporter permease [Ekhidna sp. MALMAid0563]|uniref:ABC transporter permease n=1 Tax=Ekhidna sp. MALMAid0563 TaxID=3143937 RepID=UPI0032DF40E5
MSNTPPKFASKLLSLLISKEFYEEVSGDLAEDYQEYAKVKGKFRANFIYLIEVIRYARMYRAERKRQSTNSFSMLQNYIKVAFRNLFKHKSYSIINISGLGIGLACVFMIFLFIKIETSYDKFHADGEDIYRLQHVYGYINAQAAPTYARDYSEVKSFNRINFWKTDRRVSLSNDEVYYEDLLVADSNFFNFFSFPLLRGDKHTCLKDKNSVAISRSHAEKFFGESDPIGQVLNIGNVINDEEIPFKVTAVFEDIPFNSHLQFDMVLPFELLHDDRSLNIMNLWPNDWIGSYVKLKPGTDPQLMEEKYQEMWNKYYDAEADSITIDFMPLEDLYLESYDLRSDYTAHGNINQVRIFSAIAVIILFIACINFMNLATAQASRRSKEVGIRKVMGAFRKQLIIQFFAESAIMTLMAVMLAIAILIVAIPPINRLAEIDLLLGLDDIVLVVVSCIILTLITILITGSYPALLLSSFQPISILSGNNAVRGGNGWVRKTLVVFQFTISIALIIGAMVVYKQMLFVKQKDLGFEPENTIVMNYGSSDALRRKWNIIKDQVQTVHGVKSVMASRHIPGDNAFYWGYKFEDFSDYEDPFGDPWLGYYVGHNTLDALGVEMVLGRTFSEDIPTDSSAFILNESGWKRAIEEYGESWKDPIGKSIEYYTTHSGDWAMDKKGVVIGIVKDFHHHSLERPIDPLVIHHSPSRRLMVKVQADKTNEVLSSIEEMWIKWNAPADFNYQFLDEYFEGAYKDEEQFNQFIIIFCMLAIAIACLGLYGLSAFVAEQRIKEIAVRKVLGAHERSIVGMLSRDFLRLVAIATLIGIPIAYYFMNEWLSNFAFRIDLSWYFFVIGSFIAAVIAISTISYHSIKAATSNPVNSLRSE